MTGNRLPSLLFTFIDDSNSDKILNKSAVTEKGQENATNEDLTP
jgi:hypothetical protein